MMDNYPPGAAHDPNAPYNEEPCPDIDVTVRATLVKVQRRAVSRHRCDGARHTGEGHGADGAL